MRVVSAVVISFSDGQSGILKTNPHAFEHYQPENKDDP